MPKILPALAISLFLSSAAFAASFPHQLDQWLEAPVPATAAAQQALVSALRHPSSTWEVSIRDGRPHVDAAVGRPTSRLEHPAFVPPHPGNPLFRIPRSVIAVDDGWLVGYYRGEWGGALYWFSKDGGTQYRISGDAIVQLFEHPDGIHAIQGVAHMGMFSGSVLRVERSATDGQWRAVTATQLPGAPQAISVLRDGTMLVTLHDALVSVDRAMQVRTLVDKAPWYGLYPQSSALMPAEDKLYVGMRAFVGEYDLKEGKLRLLVPPGDAPSTGAAAVTAE